MKKLFDKYKTMNIQAKAAIWFVLCSILQKGISFITVPIFTRVLTSNEYGTYSLYLSWLQILTVLTSLYLANGVFNNAMVKFDYDRDKFTSVMQGLTLTITGSIFIVFLFFQGLWERVLGLSSTIIILMFIEMLVTPALSFWSGRQRFEYQYKKLVTVTLIQSIANPVLGLIAVSLSSEHATARIASIVFVELLVCGSIMILQFRKGKVFFDKYYWKYALGLAVPLLPHYLSGIILNQGDRIMIEKMVGRSAVAFYSVAYSIGMLVQIITNAIFHSFNPWVYQKIKSSDYNGIAKTTNILLGFIAGVSFVLMLCSPELVLIFGSKEYASAAYVIPPVAASVYFIFLYNILAIPQFYYEKTQFLMYASLSAALANIILNYIFIKTFGFIAAGYTTLVCYVLYSLGHAIISKRVFQRFIANGKLFDLKFIFILSVLVILVGSGCSFLFDMWYVRYIILIVTFIIIVWNREKLMSKVCKLKGAP